MSEHCDNTPRLCAYVADCLSPADALVIEAHVQQCDGCRQELGGLLGAVDAVKAADVEPLSAARREAIRARLRAVASAETGVRHGALQIAGFATLVVGAVGGGSAAWYMGWLTRLDWPSVAAALVGIGAVTCAALAPVLRRAAEEGGSQ